MSEPIEPILRKFITDSFLYREGIDTLSDTDSFLAAGLIDSTGVLELVCFLENTFSIHVTDDEVMPENLDSIKKITSYVQRKQWAAANPLPPLGVDVSQTPTITANACAINERGSVSAS